MKMRNPEVTSRIMSSIKARNTRPEIKLGRAMWSLGLRYRKQYPIEGKPDFVFVTPRVAVFCDGDFWHGNNWVLRGFSSFEEELNNYSCYWQDKLRKNVERDKKVTEYLTCSGWLVLRFWESEIKKDHHKIAKEVLELVKSRKEQAIIKI